MVCLLQNADVGEGDIGAFILILIFMENKISTDRELSEMVPVERMIVSVRETQVILDKDLAFLYGVETRHLNQAVKRNKDRFPDDFMFRLTKQEFLDLKSQFVISNESGITERESGRGGTRMLPYAFTENGIAMLSGVLRSATAFGRTRGCRYGNHLHPANLPFVCGSAAKTQCTIFTDNGASFHQIARQVSDY